jgi:hypothetical protein
VKEKQITRLLAQDERRAKPPITLPGPTADAVAGAAPVVPEAPKREGDERMIPPEVPTTPADDERLFEALALAEINRLPTRVWANMTALWLRLPSLPPSMQKRLLMYMIEKAAGRDDPLSPKFVKRCLAPHLARVLAVPEARDRIHDIEGLRAAARCRAENPKASWSDLALAAGLQSEHARHVVRGWTQSVEFKRWVREFELRPRRGGGHSPAYSELMAKAAALCKAYPPLAEAQAQVFALIYANPAAFGCEDLVSRDRDFEKSLAAGVCQKRL